MIFRYSAALRLIFPLLVLYLHSPSTTIANPWGNGVLNALTNAANTVNNAVSIISNFACVNTDVPIVCENLHALVINVVSPGFIPTHCSALAATPHCCRQFCKPASGGQCNINGACFCDQGELPNVCGPLLSEDTPAEKLRSSEKQLLANCRPKCQSNPNGCTRAAVASNGITYVCMCYCGSD